jgi:hypothetical protein
LDEERAKIIKRLLEIHEAAAIARTLQDVVPVLPEKGPIEIKHSIGQSKKSKEEQP